jgi:hypothetical protein
MRNPSGEAMKKVSLVRRNTKTTKILVAEDGRKLGCPFGDGSAQCGTWCALFDIATRPEEGSMKARSWAMCREHLIGELDFDCDNVTNIDSGDTRHQA